MKISAKLLKIGEKHERMVRNKQAPQPMPFRGTAGGFCEMDRFAVRNGPFHRAKRPISHCDSAHFANQSDMACLATMAALALDEALPRMQKYTTRAIIIDKMSAVMRTRERRC